MPRKAVLWQQLKTAAEAGVPVPFNKPFVSYTEKELEALVDEYLGDTYAEPAASGPESAALDAEPAPEPQGIPVPEAPQTRAPGAPHDPRCESSTVCGMMKYHHAEWNQYAPETLARLLGVPFSDKAADRAGLTFNTHGPDDPLRVDSLGRVWYIDEVPKPAIPKQRMIRKVRYVNTGVKDVTRKLPNGLIDEVFEVPGERRDEEEIKIALPSSQVGVYRDPRLPFKVHIYNGRRGFERLNVVAFYGGIDLVPTGIGTVYVGSDLCYDINQTRDTMERELRDKQLGRSF
jgi:hypothetical protein